MRRTFFAAAILACLWMSPMTLADELPSRVSLVALLANPDAADGKAVIVTGYLCSENSKVRGLYLTRDDCNERNYANAIKLDVSAVKKEIGAGPRLLTVEGRFSSWASLVHTDESFPWGLIVVENVSGRTLN